MALSSRGFDPVHIIPVIDIKDGRVVRAHLGDRANYRPIETPLSPTAEIGDVARGLASLYPFPLVYVADLDAIEGRHRPLHLASKLQAALAPSAIWLDAGFSEREEVGQALSFKGIVPVIGSESQRDSALLKMPGIILSLDFRAKAFLGPEAILADAQSWPSHIIVMTLGSIGANAGPEFSRLADIKRRAGNRSVIAAGGIRDANDLHQLAAMGIEGALLATSLHNGAFASEAIASFMHKV
ncbi:HisA/HisF-related TIM barrel protein [Phyllobacterium sp. SYP-B3895]|uniref:HisA/HisF-related TIM barrel protein n=1 Tax=Phyllobacterium sp. SYP-B3895 TaxID=2663240 RepID=UPI001299D3FC|nr:HisA/HisF-related TIM barrel protein [Phyllobacterium sp. SYP-B3895]